MFPRKNGNGNGTAAGVDGVMPTAPFMEHLRELLSRNIVVHTKCGKVMGVLKAVFSDHILVMVHSVPHHIKLDTICFFHPAMDP
jgi:hypothetical protein